MPSKFPKTRAFFWPGFLDNNATNLGEKLFGATADEFCEIDGNNEESTDDNDNNFIDFVNWSRKFTRNKWWCQNKLRSKHMWYYWSPWRKGKTESEEEKEDVTDDYSADTLKLNFPTALNHVTYIKQFLINKGFNNVVEELSKAESKLEK